MSTWTERLAVEVGGVGIGEVDWVGVEAATTDRDLAYDKAGHLIRHNSSAINGQQYAYNDRGLPTKAGTDLTAPNQTWEYDADGRITKRWDKDTDLTVFGYKADGQLDWANNPKLKTQNWYGYDDDGRLNKQFYVAPDPADPTTASTASPAATPPASATTAPPTA
ncbi:hypothetical protein [Kitasatospora sp. NPDC051702]|uniref:hypothetical protein n=1 Tax=Kitasatospora sp. NPDC051702 TaxID=3155672 RepID=UPI003424A7BD